MPDANDRMMEHARRSKLALSGLLLPFSFQSGTPPPEPVLVARTKAYDNLKGMRPCDVLPMEGKLEDVPATHVKSPPAAVLRGMGQGLGRRAPAQNKGRLEREE